MRKNTPKFGNFINSHFYKFLFVPDEPIFAETCFDRSLFSKRSSQEKITDSPEYMTNLGVFDNFDFIFRHNERLSVQTSDKRNEDYNTI